MLRESEMGTIRTMLSFVFLMVVFLSPPLLGAEDKPCFTLDVQIASATSCFNVSLANSGCLAIFSTVKGRKGFERVWGPVWRDPGTFSIALPTDKLVGKSGTLEFFRLDLCPEDSIGRQGRGEKQFIHPMGIGWDEISKDLYVADAGNDRIVRLSSKGQFLGQYGGFGVAFGDSKEEKEDSLDEPWDVAPGGFSNFYVSDQNNDRIVVFDAYKNFKGTFFPKPGDKQARLNKPRGLVLDQENNLWLVDGRADRVLKFSSSGEKLFELGGFGWSAWQFKDPTQIAVDTDGRIFISDRGNRRIQIFDRLGAHIGEIKDHLKAPVGVAVDPVGLVYVCDEATSELGVYLPDGKRIGVFSEFRPGDKFRTPVDIALSKDRLFLADSGNHRILIFARILHVEKLPWQGPNSMIK